jgi:hypothetical protein
MPTRQAGILLLAPQLTGDDDLARIIHPVHLEHVLSEINADGANLHMDDPSGDSLFNDHPLAHSMPGAGVVHHIIFDRVSSVACRLTSALPRKPTFEARLAIHSRLAEAREILKNAPKISIWGEAHGSICVQERQAFSRMLESKCHQQM